jgi:hypothetical protein
MKTVMMKKTGTSTPVAIATALISLILTTAIDHRELIQLMDK